MPSQKDKNKYIKILIEEEMVNLGENICWFRNLVSDLERQGITDLQYIDGIYQRALDRVLDSLCNINDLKVADVAIKAVDKSLKIRRGMKIKDF
jgi:hypothetical protein